MSEFDDLIAAHDEAQYASEKRRTYSARLGRGDGVLTTDRIGYVWARVQLPAGVSTLVIKAHRVTIAYGAIVDVRRDTDGYYEAFRVNTERGGQEFWGRYGTGNVPQHGSTHGLYAPDPVALMSPQFLPLSVKPTSPSSKSVTVYRGIYRDTNGDLQWHADEDVDLTSEIAALSGDEQQLVVISLNKSSGALTKTTGATTDDPTDRTYVPFDTDNALAIDVTDDELPLYAVRIYADHDTITRVDMPEWLDLRDWLTSGGGSGGALATQLDTETVANTTTETSMVGTIDGSMAIPADTLEAGETIMLSCGGYYSATGTPLLTIKVKIDGVEITSVGASVSTVTDGGWHLEALLTVHSIGASGTLALSGIHTRGSTVYTLVNPTLTAIDTTTDLLVEVTATWGTANAANTITSQVLALWQPGGGGSGGGSAVTDHGGLTGLGDDDHPQYHNDTRGDIRYYTKTQIDTTLGSYVTLTGSETLTNKTLGNTNIVTLRDDRFTLQDDGDTTKQARFQLSGFTTGTTRTITLPNRDTGLVILTPGASTDNVIQPSSDVIPLVLKQISGQTQPHLQLVDHSGNEIVRFGPKTNDGGTFKVQYVGGISSLEFTISFASPKLVMDRFSTGQDNQIIFATTTTQRWFVGMYGSVATDDFFIGYAATKTVRLGQTTNDHVLTIDSNGRVGVNLFGASAAVHIDQPSVTAAIPVLTVDQADVSEEFIRFIGSSANGVLTQSIVEAADVATPTIAGYLKIYVQDDGNQLTDQAYFLPIYTLA